MLIRLSIFQEVVLTKTGGAETYIIDVLTSPKNQSISDSILNPQPEEPTEEVTE